LRETAGPGRSVGGLPEVSPALQKLPHLSHPSNGEARPSTGGGMWLSGPNLPLALMGSVRV